MADSVKRAKPLKDIVRESRYWDAEDLLRNLDEEMERMEQGLCHMAWDQMERPVTRRLRPLPMTPKFEVDERGNEFTISVQLPNVPQENMKVNVLADRVEVLACSEDAICRPYFASVESHDRLDPDSVSLKLTDSTLHVKVKKAKKKRVKIK
jgi:HSP20 family molecular chaperone IbpA